MRREVREFSDAGADEMPEELRSVSVQRFSENVNIRWKAYGGISDILQRQAMWNPARAEGRQRPVIQWNFQRSLEGVRGESESSRTLRHMRSLGS